VIEVSASVETCSRWENAAEAPRRRSVDGKPQLLVAMVGGRESGGGGGGRRVAEALTAVVGTDEHATTKLRRDGIFLLEGVAQRRSSGVAC
jgi:hypothetical protein